MWNGITPLTSWKMWKETSQALLGICLCAKTPEILCISLERRLLHAIPNTLSSDACFCYAWVTPRWLYLYPDIQIKLLFQQQTFKGWLCTRWIQMPGKNCKGTKIKVVAKSYGFLFSSALQYALQNQKKKKKLK